MDLQIENINFGNKVFNDFLNNETLFIRMFKFSAPYRFCIKAVFMELINLGVYESVKKLKTQIVWQEAIEEAKKMFTTAGRHNEGTMAVLVLAHFAEQRLKKTTGL